MAFKGSQNYPDQHARELLSSLGGVENAFTSRDFTVFHQTVASEHLDTVLAIEADRMQNLLLQEEDLESERKVVTEERRLVIEDRPNALFFEQFNLINYRTSPYRHPIIGWHEDISRYTPASLKEWYQKWYCPNHATLVIGGDVQAEQALTQIKNHFESLPACPPQVRQNLNEHTFPGQIKANIAIPARLPLLVMSYPAPALNSHTLQDQKDVYSLQILSALLSEGYSSRLENRLVREKSLAAFASSHYQPFVRGEAQFMLIGRPANGIEMSRLIDALKTEIAHLQSTPVEEKELQKIRTRLLAQTYYERDALDSRTRELGIVSSLGLDWKLIESYPDTLTQITPEQILSAAQRYLKETHLTIATLDPVSDEVSPQ
jgi:zinc protease